jgi:hypothetical protein
MLPVLQPEMWTTVAWVDDVETAGIQDMTPSPTGTTRLDRRGQRWLFLKGRLKDGENGGARGREPAGHHEPARREYPKTNGSGRWPRPSTSGSIRRPTGSCAGRRGLMIAIGLVL